jgi:hypothetical protein
MSGIPGRMGASGVGRPHAHPTGTGAAGRVRQPADSWRAEAELGLLEVFVVLAVAELLFVGPFLVYRAPLLHGDAEGDGGVEAFGGCCGGPVMPRRWRTT